MFSSQAGMEGKIACCQVQNMTLFPPAAQQRTCSSMGLCTWCFLHEPTAGVHSSVLRTLLHASGFTGMTNTLSKPLKDGCKTSPAKQWCRLVWLHASIHAFTRRCNLLTGGASKFYYSLKKMFLNKKNISPFCSYHQVKYLKNFPKSCFGEKVEFHYCIMHNWYIIHAEIKI